MSSGGDHMFLHGGYPDLTMNGSTVSLTLGLQQQQTFASSMMQQQRSAGLMLLAGGDEQLTTESALPYRNLMGSRSSLHD
jgi:hypothetical protein